MSTNKSTTIWALPGTFYNSICVYPITLEHKEIMCPQAHKQKWETGEKSDISTVASRRGCSILSTPCPHSCSIRCPWCPHQSLHLHNLPQTSPLLLWVITQLNWNTPCYNHQNQLFYIGLSQYQILTEWLKKTLLHCYHHIMLFWLKTKKDIMYTLDAQWILWSWLHRMSCMVALSLFFQLLFLF